MKIKGHFNIISNNKLISSGQNIIVDNGKKIFFDWFLHKAYLDNDSDYVYQGTSLSSERFLKSSEYIVAGNGNSSIQQFWDNTNSSTIYNNNVVYLQIVGQPINLSGLLFYLPYSHSISNDQNYQWRFRYKIYTSSYEYSYANANNLWTMQKVCVTTTQDNTLAGNQKVIRFQTVNSVDGYVSQVRSIKIVFFNLQNNNWRGISLTGVGILEKTPYMNVPCVIGLGSNSNTPSVSNVSLNQQVCKLFVNSQKSYITYTKNENDNLNSSQSSESESSYQIYQNNSFDLNCFSESQLLNLNTINIVYRTRLNYSQYNNVQFKQIGLFYSNNRVDFNATANSVYQMFSHGIFDVPWSKSSNQMIDVEYILSIVV